jgi:hypothetical protein
MKSPRPQEGNRSGAGIRPVLLAAIAVLYVFSVPWYRGDHQPLELVLGLPDWVAVAVLCYAGVAVLNALAWLRTPIEDDAPLAPTLQTREPSQHDGPPPGRGEEAR